MSLEPANPDAVRKVKYLQIASDLIEQIRAGELKEGDKIPSTHELAAQYDVTSATVQAAVRMLKQGRYVEGRQGSGTFVLSKDISDAAYLLGAKEAYADPAKAPGVTDHRVQEQYTIEHEMERLQAHRTLAETDREYRTRFMRQLRLCLQKLDLEKSYWQEHREK